jgi:hypothetical protein
MLDDQAEISVCQPHLLTDVVTLPISEWINLSGINKGEPTRITQKGNLAGLCDVYASSEVNGNVLCFADMEDMYELSYNQCVSMVLHAGIGDITFDRVDKHYVCDFEHIVRQKRRAFATVSDKKNQYTSAQVKRADKVHKLWIAFEMPGIREFKLMMAQMGGTDGLVPEDVDRAADIYGPSTAALGGKLRRHRVPTLTVDRTLKSVTRQTLYAM